MKILAVDTSCDESCAAIIDTASWKLLADVVHTHIDKMSVFGGVVPEIASREHLKALPLAVSQALAQAGLKESDLDWLAVTQRPGLIGALLVGVSFVKALAFASGKPWAVMNHIEGHLFSPWLASLEGKTPPPFPWVALVVSGGHSEIFLVKNFLDYQRLGGTLDDAAGEAFDKVGKLLGLPYPAGPALDRWVKEKATEADRRQYRFPRAAVEGVDLSFSGLKTAVSLQIKKEEPLSDEKRLAIAASAQEAILDALAQKARRAKKETGAQSIVVTGGVACNSRIRELLPEAYFPERRHCTDNAAMIALLAGIYLREKKLVAAPWEASAMASGVTA